MKIGLVILHADSRRGGAERYTLDLASELGRRGHDVWLLASSFADDAQGQTIHLRANGITRLAQYRHFLDSLDEHLQIAQYDIVHAMLPVRRCDLYHPHAGLAGGRIERNWINRLNRKRKYFAGVEHELLTSSHPPIVLCLSKYIQNALRQIYSLNEKYLATLYNGVDLSRFSPGPQGPMRESWQLAAGQSAALMIAQDFERKGLKQAILALHGLPKVKLVVVGKEPVGKYRALARQTGVADRVIFAGATADPVSYYRAADFFVLPTRHDPCSLVVLEALACGLPVISTQFNGACEVMTDGLHGYVLPDANDVDALHQRMQQIMLPEVNQAMRQACLQLRNSLSQEQHVTRLEEIYNSRM